MIFSDRVKYARMRRQLSRKDMAQEIGVSAVALGRWERGEVEPRLAQLGRFYAYCEKSGISFDNMQQSERVFKVETEVWHHES